MSKLNWRTHSAKTEWEKIPPEEMAELRKASAPPVYDEWSVAVRLAREAGIIDEENNDEKEKAIQEKRILRPPGDGGKPRDLAAPNQGDEAAGQP